jgi:hypothetical protein
MRKFLMAVVVVVALAIPVAALAATLDTSKFGDLIAYGEKCENGAYYHFVNNQTGGAPDGTLNAMFGPPTGLVTTGPYATAGPNVQHFSAFAEGPLLWANTGSLPGKLVLSDVSCKK